MTGPCGLLVVAAVAWLAGCTVGPDYLTPGMPVPTSFGSKGAPVSDKTPAANITRWWRALHDRELDSLVDRAVAGSPDIEMALMRVQQAREQEVVVVGAALPQVGISSAEAVSSGNNPTKGRVTQTLNSGVNTNGYEAVTQVSGFDAGWEIDLFGKYRRALEAAIDDTQAALELRNAVLITVVSAYLCGLGAAGAASVPIPTASAPYSFRLFGLAPLAGGRDHLKPPFEQAVKLAFLGCFSDAAKVFGSVARQDPKEPGLWWNIALCHAWAGEDPLAHSGRQIVVRANRWRRACGEEVDFGLDDFDISLRRLGHAPVGEDTLAHGEPSTHIAGQIKPHYPHPGGAAAEPSARQPPPPRSPHRAFADATQVALDGHDGAGNQRVERSQMAPILITRGQVKNQVADRCDAAVGKRRRPLGPHS